jgi:hypothetical protein
MNFSEVIDMTEDEISNENEGVSGQDSTPDSDQKSQT